MSLLLSVVVSFHLIFTAISQSQCEDYPSRTTYPYDSSYYYNACIYPSMHSVSQSTVHITYSSYASKWFHVTFSPLIHDCVGPKITFQYQETTYLDYRNYIRIYDSNKNTIKQSGTLEDCRFTDSLTEYSLYDNLGLSVIKAGSNYTFPIYHYYIYYSHTCSGLGVNANLTLSCLQVPSTPTDELVVDEPFRCSYLAENIAVVYDLNYIECVYWQCFEEYGSSCKMVNYLANTNPTRCYLFDKQCVMQSSEDSGDAVTFAIEGENYFCVDYPYQWADLWSDTCDQYENLLNLCTDGRKTDVETVDYFKSQMYDGFTALDVCCACGGGQHVVGDVILTFDPVSKFNDGDVLCTTNYDTIRTMHNEKHWDNVMLFRLCKLLYDTVWWMLSYTLDCTMFLESTLDNSLTFSVFICDFDEYVDNTSDPYFLFGISMENSTTTSTFINNLWFDIVPYLLPSVPVNVSHTECFSMLSNMNASNAFLAVPCDEYIASPTSSPTLNPTEIPTQYPTQNPSHPTLTPTQPTMAPTTSPIQPIPSMSPATPNPTQYPTLHCEDNPDAINYPYGSTDYYDACIYPSVYSSTEFTIHITRTSVGSRWFQVTFSPLIHDCVGPKITFQYQEIAYSHSYNYIRIYDSSKNTIKQSGTLSDCRWTDSLTAYSLYDNLGVSVIKAGSNYTFPIYHYFRYDSHTCSGLGVNANLTLSCFKVPSTPTDDLVVDQPFRCSYLTESAALFYDLNYIECVYQQCFAEFGSSCRMVNYLGNTSPTRCYLFDKQCVMQSSEDSGDVVTFATDVQSDFCVDYPSQWTDSWLDTCDEYENLLNLCTDGRKTDTETVQYFKSHMHDGFTALDVCCVCGGGQRIIQDVIMTFDSLSKLNDGDVLCTTNHDVIRTLHDDKHWDNIMLYKLCTRLFDTIWWMLSYTLDCTMFLDSNIDDSLTFSVFICDFEGYVETDYDPYFLFAISTENSTSTSTFINNLWFDIIAYLLPSVPVTVSYTECFSMLSNINASNSFLAVPCDQYISSPTSSPTLKPNPLPTTTLPPTDSPTQPPTSRPTGTPTAPTAPTAPTVPTDYPSKNPTLKPTTMPTKYPTLPTDYPTKNPTLKPTAVPTDYPIKNPTLIPTPPTLPTASTSPTTKPTPHPTTSNPTNQSIETTMVEADAMGEKSAVGLWKTTITVIFAGVLSTLILTFLFSYLWKHKIKGAQQENVEMAVQHQGVRDELVERFDIQEM